MRAVSARAGIVTAPSHVENRVTITFTGKALPLFGRTLLMGLLSLLILPTSWTAAWFFKWFVGRVRMSDGTTASFNGRGGEIWLAFIALGVLSIASGVGPGEWRMLIGALSVFLVPLFKLMIFRWQVRSVKLSSGVSFTFTGRYWPYLGWQLLWLVSLLTIVGWAWVDAAYYRWLCRNVDGGQCRIEFTGSGWNILWRTLAVVLSCLLIVPIPWTGLWLVKWYVRNVSIQQATGRSPIEAGFRWVEGE
jgi:hypothetical protein